MASSGSEPDPKTPIPTGGSGSDADEAGRLRLAKTSTLIGSLFICALALRELARRGGPLAVAAYTALRRWF